MKTFKEVVESLGNNSYSRVELRINIMVKDKKHDVFAGLFAYDADAGRIIPLDGDTYDVNMLCEQWSEFETDKGKCLCVYAVDGKF